MKRGVNNFREETASEPAVFDTPMTAIHDDRFDPPHRPAFVQSKKAAEKKSVRDKTR